MPGHLVEIQALSIGGATYGFWNFFLIDKLAAVSRSCEIEGTESYSSTDLFRIGAI